MLLSSSEILQGGFGLVLFTATFVLLIGAIARLFYLRIKGRNLHELLSKNLALCLHYVREGVIIVDQDHNILQMNPEAARISGWSQTEALGQPLLEVYKIIDFKTREPMDNWVARLSQPETPDTSSILLEGRHGWGARIVERGGPFRLEGHKSGWILLFKDISDELALQERLHHGQKMESMGLLAGGIAHDFNNMLSGIMGAAELIQDDLPQNSPSSAMVEIIIRTSERAASLTQKLLSFSRKGKSDLHRVEINTVVQEAVGILEHSVDKKIKIIFTHLKKQSFIKGDPSQIQNSILNLGVNARDALPHGGTLNISITEETLGESFGKNFYLPAKPGEYFVINVKDNGKGMDEDIKSRLFDPFFTTKALGEGTGLGLVAVLRCMKEHEGALWYSSEANKGTEFRLYFPVNSEGPGVEIVPFIRPTYFSGKALLVDDEEILQTTVGEMLISLGFTTVKAGDGEEAWELLRKNSDFNVALIDMMMPRMGGQDLLKKIRKTYPQITIIVMSGFTKPWEIQRLIHEGASAFIQKPFLRKKLAQELSKVLNPRLDSQPGKP